MAFNLYRICNKFLGQGNVLTHVCHSAQEGVSQHPLGYRECGQGLCVCVCVYVCDVCTCVCVCVCVCTCMCVCVCVWTGGVERGDVERKGCGHGVYTPPPKMAYYWNAFLFCNAYFQWPYLVNQFWFELVVNLAEQ